MDDFDLKTSSGAFDFFFQLHNLPSALPPDAKLKDAKSQLDRLKELVDHKKLPSFTGRPSNHPKMNHNAPPGDKTSPFDDPFTAQQVSGAGYQLLPEIPVEGWTRLNPVGSLLI